MTYLSFIIIFILTGSNFFVKTRYINENGEAYEPHASIITSTNKKAKEVFERTRM